jgi:heme-degrading monooxygenase HmoA
MYANLTTFTLGPGKRSTGEKLVAQFAPALAAREGFESATFLADDASGTYGVLVVFASKEAAQATWETLSPRLAKALDGIAQGPANRTLFEVLEPVA